MRELVSPRAMVVAADDVYAIADGPGACLHRLKRDGSVDNLGCDLGKSPTLVGSREGSLVVACSERVKFECGVFSLGRRVSTTSFEAAFTPLTLSEQGYLVGTSATDLVYADVVHHAVRMRSIPPDTSFQAHRARWLEDGHVVLFRSRPSSTIESASFSLVDVNVKQILSY